MRGFETRFCNLGITDPLNILSFKIVKKSNGKEKNAEQITANQTHFKYSNNFKCQ